MQIAFFSNFMNHHQLYFCLEMRKRLGEGFTFVATEDVPAFGVIDIQDPNHTSIHSVDAEKTAGDSYDLSGRRANPTTKGVVINNGKKTLF